MLEDNVRPEKSMTELSPDSAILQNVAPKLQFGLRLRRMPFNVLPLAPICRSRTGSNTAIIAWVLNATHQMDPIRRSETKPERWNLGCSQAGFASAG